MSAAIEKKYEALSRAVARLREDFNVDSPDYEMLEVRTDFLKRETQNLQEDIAYYEIAVEVMEKRVALLEKVVLNGK